MGWFSGAYYRARTEEPYKTITHIEHGPKIEKYFLEDVVWENAKLAVINLDLSTYAKHKAYRHASYVAKNGVEYEGVQYPAHRIWKVDIIKCEWKTVLEEVRHVATEKGLE